MLEAISRIRQMMAESKFHEAQRAAELHLSTPNDPLRPNVLPLYLELLELQDKSLPVPLLLEAAENDRENVEQAQRWIEKIGDEDLGGNRRKFLMLKMSLAEKRGRLDELYDLISEFQLHLFSNRVPARVPQVHDLIVKYFKGDFRLRLQELAVDLMLGDLTSAETLARELIYSCVEKASPRGIREKLLAIAEVIKTSREKSPLELYHNYCSFRADGIREKGEYKKLAELFIYFEEFRFQVLLLDLLERLDLRELSSDYADTVKSNPQYDFVYLDKYFGHLKKYFVRVSKPTGTSPEEELPKPDLKLEEPVKTLVRAPQPPKPLGEEEAALISTLKYQDHSVQTLIELAVSFLQSDFPRAALKASEMAMGHAEGHDFLRAAYLRATALYQVNDFRACLDVALTALKKAESKDDVLSFLYLQAEVLTQLGEKKHARAVLEKIMSVDSSYRLTRERLKRLDEV